MTRSRDARQSNRVNVYFAFLRSGARPRPILPPLTVQEVYLLLSQSRPRWFDRETSVRGLRVRVQKDTVRETRHSA